ncbi:hypothetical protein Fmac_012259 [Flemingia macrophylla]|uniref:Uncharacterized protein n=1 Tax=Flemingia macrophylla TaxID=520843 RepID=A0ABD1MPR7_9FABA
MSRVPVHIVVTTPAIVTDVVGFALVRGLVSINVFVQIAVVVTLIDYLNDSGKDLRLIVVVTNLQDGLSSIFVIVVSAITEAYTGCFTMITFCTASSIQGLMLLWASTSPAAFGYVYAAIFFLALGARGQKILENFLEYQLGEKFKAEQPEHGSTEKKEKENKVDIMRKLIWLSASKFIGIVVIVCIAYSVDNETYGSRFRIAALLMEGTFLFFIIGNVWYRREELSVETNLRKIYRICNAAFGKRRSKYPTSPSCYHWKGCYKQEHLYEGGNGKGLRLHPKVPRLFKWLDKAAIIDGEECSDPGMQEEKGKLCMVKEVREVKSLVAMIYLAFTFSAFSLLVATGKTFFVAQASNLTPVMTSNNGKDISILFAIKNVGKNVLGESCNFIIKTRAFQLKKSKRKVGTIIMIGLGMVFAVICSLVAWKVEIHRLSINKEGDFKHAGGNTTRALVPQFSLLGISEGFVDSGLSSLFCDQVAESLASFEDSYRGLFIGSGKLMIIPLVLIIRSWFKETVNASRLDLYYIFLAILNAVFLLVYAYYSSRYAYNYKEERPKDNPPYSVERLENEELTEVTVDFISGKGNRIFLHFYLSPISCFCLQVLLDR